MKSITPDIRLSLAMTRAPSAPERGPDTEALRQKCLEFEAIFIESMFKSMRATVPDGGLLEKGPGTEIFEELRDAESARQMARHQGIGLGEALFRQLQLLQPTSDPSDKA